MKVTAIGNLFPSNSNGEQNAITYLEENGLYSLIRSSAESQDERIQPKYRDLARLHAIVRSRKAFSAVELGVGFSTLVVADALKKNESCWQELTERPAIREADPFKLYSVDGSAQWIEATKGILPAHLEKHVSFQVSGVTAGTFSGRVCHYYDQYPNIVPDFLYIDGPDPTSVQGEINGQSWSNPSRLVMSADFLAIEPHLLPGALVVIDGRTANARFIAANLYRNWSIYRNPNTDVTVMELQEMPLGVLNRNILEYQLGDEINNWPEPLNRERNE